MTLLLRLKMLPNVLIVQTDSVFVLFVCLFFLPLFCQLSLLGWHLPQKHQIGKIFSQGFQIHVKSIMYSVLLLKLIYRDL